MITGNHPEEQAMSMPNEELPAPSGMGFKIATIILAVTTLGFAIWGFATYQSLNTANKAISSENATIAAEEAALTAAKQEIAKLQSNYAVEEGNFNDKQEQLVKQRAVYDAAKKKASKNKSKLDAQLAASQAESALAQKCAAVLASGLIKISGDASTPKGATSQEVVAEMNKASVPCKGVVTITPSAS
ncbi:MAG: septal ring factor EnvC (AmiA/AmiB activator) [Actinomycetes bacterium]|jgi:septal ring factor EnvC (AmiA/AmiB activator)